jgi:hypothetical protein
LLRKAIPSHGAVTGAIGRGALAPGLIPASRGPRMEGGCRRFFAIGMLTSARPGQASATTPAARSTSASSKCTMTGPALALLNARRGIQASGDEGGHRDQDGQRRHRDPGPGQPLTNTTIITDD